MANTPFLAPSQAKLILQNEFPPRKGVSVQDYDYYWLIHCYNVKTSDTNQESRHICPEKNVPSQETLKNLAWFDNFPDYGKSELIDDQRAIRLVEKLLAGTNAQQTLKTIGITIATTTTLSQVAELHRVLRWNIGHSNHQDECELQIRHCKCQWHRRSYLYWLRDDLCWIRREYLLRNPICEDSPEEMNMHLTGFPLLRLPLELREQIYNYLLPDDKLPLQSQAAHSFKPQSGATYRSNGTGEYAHFPALCLVNRQVATEARNLLYRLHSFAIDASDRGLNPYLTTSPLLMGRYHVAAYVRQNCSFAASVKKWHLRILCGGFWQSRNPCHPINGSTRRARVAVNKFVAFVQSRAPATRTLQVSIVGMKEYDEDTPRHKEYLLRPLRQLRGLDSVHVIIPCDIIENIDNRYLEEICAWTKTLSAFMVTDWDYDLEMTQDWGYLTEAARRSPFLPKPGPLGETA